MAAPEELRGKILLAAQEITFAKVLAGNDKPTRDRGVKRLRKWLTARSEGSLEFSEEDHLTLWKGLFYCMWMSDKPLVQEDLAEQISNLIHCFKKSHQGILFLKCFFQTIAREWFGIDQFRLDKFMMLVRRCVRQLFTFCCNHGWTPKSCEEVGNLFESVLLNSPNNAIGLLLHISDIILEELAKAGGGENVILYVIKPWAKLIGMHHDRRIRQHVVDRVFHHLIRQSNLGIEFQDKFDAWKEAGFPGNSWREMEAVEADDVDGEDVNTESSKNGIILDPRAGKVDVELPQIMFEPEEVSNILHEEQSRAVLLRGRKALHLLSSQFKQLADGHYPLGFKKPPGFKQKLHKRKAEGELWDAAEDLLEYESEVILREKRHIEEDEKDELVQPTKKKKLKKITVEGVLSKSQKKKLRMKKLKQKLSKSISNKVKPSLTNKSNSENLLGDTNCITHKITPAKKHQQHTKCVPEAKILCSMQADSCNDELKPVVSETIKVKNKRKSQEGKSPKLNVVTHKKCNKSPLKERTSNNEIELIGSLSPKRKKNKITSAIESNILTADSVSPHLQDSGFNSTSNEGKIDSIQADTCNEEQKPVISVMLQPKQKKQSLEGRKSPNLSVKMLKKSKKSPLKEVISTNEILLTASPSPKQKNKQVFSGIENGILSVDSVSPQLQDSGSNSTSIECKILDTIQACNEQKPFVSVMKQTKNKRHSSGERKSPKQNIEKTKKSPLKEMTFNKLKLIDSPSPTRKKYTINNTDLEDNTLSAVSACPQLHDSNSDVIVLEKDDDMCTDLKTPLKHKNSPVLIKEPINEVTLRRSLRIRTPIKTNIELTPIGRSVKSRSSLSSMKSKKQRLSECESETSFLGSQVGAILVQKFESSTGEGSKQTKRNSVNRRAVVCDQQQISLVSEPQSEKTPVTSKVTKIKARKSTNNSTPQQNTSLQLEGSGKKVNIVLKKNMTQGFMEYEQAVRNSPDIPFDASKKPIQGVLKPTSVPSPLNPFYKLNKIKL